MEEGERETLEDLEPMYLAAVEYLARKEVDLHPPADQVPGKLQEAIVLVNSERLRQMSQREDQPVGEGDDEGGPEPHFTDDQLAASFARNKGRIG